MQLRLVRSEKGRKGMKADTRPASGGCTNIYMVSDFTSINQFKMKGKSSKQWSKSWNFSVPEIL